MVKLGIDFQQSFAFQRARRPGRRSGLSEKEEKSGKAFHRVHLGFFEITCDHSGRSGPADFASLYG